MKPKLQIAFAILLGLALSGAALADDDLTMSAVDVEDAPETVVNTIELPEFANEHAVTSASFGLDTANQARELGREFGAQMAEEARDGNVSERIRDTIGDARDRAPDHRPEVPGRP